MKNYKIPAILSPRSAPDVSALINNMENALTDSGDFQGRMENNERIKGCSWDGQSADGRKHEDDLGHPATPWEGASDAQVPLAEIIITEQNLLCTTALAAGMAQAEAVDGADDPAAASAVGPVLKWLRSGPRRRLLRDQIDRAVNGMNTYGHSVLAVEWHTERGLREEELTEADLLGMAQRLMLQTTMPGLQQVLEAGQENPENAQSEEMTQAVQEAEMVLMQTEQQLQAALLDPAKRPELEALVGQLLNGEEEETLHVDKDEICRLVAALQAGEPGIYYRPYLKTNEPRFEALMPFVDVFYPANTTELDRAEWVARVRWFTKTRLQDLAALEGWDEAWVEQVLKHAGHAFAGLIGPGRSWLLGGAAVRRGIMQSQQTEEYQIVEIYHKATCKGGTPVLYRSLIHPSVTGLYGYHEPVNTVNTGFPFVALRRERTESPYLLDSRGIPEMVQSRQDAIKRQHDSATNRTDQELTPPALVPSNRAGNEWSLGPNAQIPVRRSGTLEFMKIPPVSIDSSMVRREEWRLVNIQFGRMSEDVPSSVTQQFYTKVTTDFLVDIGSAFQLAWGLCQAYWPEEVWQRIAGVPKPALDPYGFDLNITFDVRNLNMEWIMELVKLYSMFILPLDAEGVFDRAKFVEYVVGMVSPQAAGRFILSKDAAAQSETEDELTQLAIIMSGAEPPQKQGQNYALRLGVLERFLQASQEIQQRLTGNEQMKAVFSARVKYFQAQMQQQQNAITGRTMQQTVMS